MQVPLEIAYRNLESSAWLERAIRAYVGKLERFHPRLVRCRVSVERRHHSHRTGNVYEVHIALRMPHGVVAISREQLQAAAKYVHPDLRRSLRDSFAAAERRLNGLKTQPTRSEADSQNGG
jgi:hypothetical protein